MRSSTPLFLLVISCAAGQNAPPRLPTCDAAEHHQFDFWAGNWEVKSGNETVGYSRIEKALHGCAIVENWTGVDGDTGKSLNFFDGSSSEWRQIYVGPNWNLDYHGKIAGSDMVFRSTRKLPDGRSFQLRLTFTPLPNGEVRQHKQRSADGDKWTEVYDFRYIRRSSEPPAVPAKAACTSGPSRQFDFWTGDWDVYVGNTLAGTNRVDRVVADCLLFENWIGSKGGEGKSFNFYDAERNEWRQVWVAPGGTLDLHGTFVDGALRYTGETLRRDGSLVHQRLTFTPQPSGSVKQFWEQSTDGGTTWAVAFDGLYVPHGTKPPAIKD